MPTQQIGSTLRVPLGRPVIVGSMTFAPAEDAGLGAARGNPVDVYLVATTSIVKSASK
jgi:3D (Asp-Asp-Asp) domain-containing protein